MKKKIAYPIINKEICNGCQRCVEHCRQNCLLISKETNEMGYHYAYYSGEGCTGCGDCYYTCPDPLALEVHVWRKK